MLHAVIVLDKQGRNVDEAVGLSLHNSLKAAKRSIIIEAQEAWLESEEGDPGCHDGAHKIKKPRTLDQAVDYLGYDGVEFGYEIRPMAVSGGA